MIKLQYWNGKEWIDAGTFVDEIFAWEAIKTFSKSRYRTVDDLGRVITKGSDKT